MYADDDHQQADDERPAHESDRAENEVDWHPYSPPSLLRALWGIATARYCTDPKLRTAL